MGIYVSSLTSTLGCMEHCGCWPDIFWCSIVFPPSLEYGLDISDQRQETIRQEMDPIGHVHMYLTLPPYSIKWLLDSKSSSNTSTIDKINYGFILYTAAATAISLLLDSSVIDQMVLGNDPGLYPFAPKGSDDEKTK